MKKFLLLPVIAIVFVIAWWLLEHAPQSANVPQQNPPEVVVYTAETQAVRDEVEALGNVIANESVVITPKVSDLVTAIYFHDGDMVTAGQLLLQLNDAQQQAQLQQAQVQLAENRRELKRIRGLVDNRTIAASEQDRLQTLIDSALAQVAAATAAVNDRQIRAPFAGRLGLRQISLGGLVTPGTVITTLDDIATIKLDFPVPERFIQQLQPGKKVEASAVAYDNTIFHGVVTTIDSRINPETRAVTVRAVLSNSDAKLLPGMLMKVRLIKQAREALLLPESAIVPIQQQHQVYVVADNHTASRREVTIGLRTRGWVEITSGVTAGEQVIVRGLMKVRDGQPVLLKNAESFSQ
ncbi:efflux RND transporter periplasmic adaptor subunit [Shewanella dokdonensis]|uniref:Efflux RND transporter periplasmic adaptor subunit n=1 Tax=Shewanella dokdonensis TaxID=712036 RepID=A0ABX8DE94_9GAMM|nr:efflux RND transporter periplasmic adaptor subunit [Shewanella dokdonensis]MCL1073051.1 efflux RND transporter periplasmic adaptor subunit [Shewanella dokdonensis]QVK23049.1 efflux RND transporter periplasmic adaptor subunit [Shewanella dokdonensis]